ncbi:hypothetical protein [Rhizobium laguerreae]|uniref:hypothetical protein n=1 Tax=Rhizobium laguerreae TaxID=1076926 RepID=UPI001C906376|nr:hypothetical protein [Rhizobium laguerreae]MBY3369069.1 hypothetical protein [Rhizobium laguerreae]
MRKIPNDTEGHGSPFGLIETYNHRLARDRAEQGSADYEMWAADPELWEKLSVVAATPDSTWVHRVGETQARELRQSFRNWRREFCSGPSELNFLDTPGRLVDRIEDGQLHLAVTALTENFLHSVGPEAKALGVPAEALLWAGMLNDEVTTKTTPSLTC